MGETQTNIRIRFGSFLKRSRDSCHPSSIRRNAASAESARMYARLMFFMDRNKERRPRYYTERIASFAARVFWSVPRMRSHFVIRSMPSHLTYVIHRVYGSEDWDLHVNPLFSCSSKMCRRMYATLTPNPLTFLL